MLHLEVRFEAAAALLQGRARILGAAGKIEDVERIFDQLQRTPQLGHVMEFLFGEPVGHAMFR
jgi:hypothetical protein